MQGTALQIVYGADIKDETDVRLSISSAAVEAIIQSSPGHYLVEILPFLRHVPSWVPGADFQKLFARCKAANDRLKHTLYDEVRGCLVSRVWPKLATARSPFQDRGEDRSGIAADIITKMRGDNNDKSAHALEEIEIAKNTCAVAVEGKHGPRTGDYEF